MLAVMRLEIHFLYSLVIVYKEFFLFVVAMHLAYIAENSEAGLSKSCTLLNSNNIL